MPVDTIKPAPYRIYVLGIIIFLSGIFASIILLLSILNKPIADDYWSFGTISSIGALHHLTNYYQVGNGRWAQNLLVTMAYKMFGATTVQIMPMLLLVSLAAGIYLVLHSLGRRVPFGNQRGVLLLVSIYIAAFSVLTSISVFDSLLWTTSSTVYWFSIILFLFGLAYLLFFRQTKRRRYIFAALILFFAGQAICEPMSLLSILIVGGLCGHDFVRRDKANFRAGIAVLVTQVVGFLTLYLSPGTQVRIHTTASVASHDIVGILTHSFGDYLFVIQSYASYRGLLLLLSIVLVSFLVRRSGNQQNKEIYRVGAGLMIVPAAIALFTNFWSQGYMPLRSYTMVSFFFSLGALLVGSRALSRIVGVLPARYVAPGLAILTTISIMTFFIKSPVTETIQAVALRSSAVMERDISIHSQLANHKESILIPAAPLLLATTDATDLNFRPRPQTDWFVDGLKRYYHIPASATVTIEDTQPTTYCTETRASDFSGAASCGSL